MTTINYEQLADWKESEISNFIKAVKKDEFAEVKIRAGYDAHLVTDWEGDGEFVPFIVVNHISKEKRDKAMREIRTTIKSNINCRIKNMYYQEEDEHTDTIYPERMELEDI